VETETVALAHPFDLAATLNSGQVFHWNRHEDGFVGLIGEVPAFLAQPAPGELRIDSPQPGAVKKFLALDHDMAAIRRSFPRRDARLAEACDFCPGLRILRQPVWECLATFITSSLKQVSQIRGMSLRLRAEFGRPLPFRGAVLHTYPSPGTLAEAGEAQLRACQLGYRAAYLHRAAIDIASGALELEALRGRSTSEVRAALRGLHGVGAKVANCVLLFAYERIDAFPVDVWIERALRQLYFAGSTGVTAKAVREFAGHHFGPNGGYAQQFLFHYARMTGLKSPDRD